MTLSNERLREMSECVNGGPYLREMATEILALRAEAERLAWIQNYHADITFSAGMCSLRGWDGGSVIYGFGSDLSAAVDSGMRNIGGKA